MTRRAGRLLLVLAIAFAAWLADVPLLGGPDRAGTSNAASDGLTVPTSCTEMEPGWSEVGVDLESTEPPVEPGRVFHLSDGTIAVLVVVTAANAEGQATSFDFSASVRVAAVIIRAEDGGAVVPFDPPVRNGAGLAAPNQAGIDGVAFCYRVQVPNPPEPGATEVPRTTPTVEASPTGVAETPAPAGTATATPGTFDVGAVQTASALATEVADAQATARAAEATREAEAAASEATIAALATARAGQDATVTAQATTAAAAATAAAEEQAALQATASAEVAAAQATSAALATADTIRQGELATARAVQTEAAATIAALQSATAAPSPTPAETRYYGVPDDEKFDAWAASLPPGWTVADGQLVADGSGFQGYVQPPRTVDRDDYAIEAEIRIVEEPACAANFGLLVRGSETGFYAGGVEWVCDAGSSVRIWALNNVLAQDSWPINQEWHTYRIAVNGDQVTVSVDGTQVLQATDASFPAGGQIALWSNGVKLEVRAFRVLVAS